MSFQPTAQLAAYGSVTVPFTFRPLSQGSVEVAVEVQYSHPSCKPQQVLVKATAIPPPIFVEEVGSVTRLSLKICTLCTILLYLSRAAAMLLLFLWLPAGHHRL